MSRRRRESDPDGGGGGSYGNSSLGLPQDACNGNNNTNCTVAPHPTSSTVNSAAKAGEASPSSSGNKATGAASVQVSPSPSAEQRHPEEDNSTVAPSTVTRTSVFEASRTREPCELSPSFPPPHSSSRLLSSHSPRGSTAGRSSQKEPHQHSHPFLSTSSAEGRRRSSHHLSPTGQQAERLAPPSSSRSADPKGDPRGWNDRRDKEGEGGYFFNGSGGGYGTNSHRWRRRRVLLGPEEKVKIVHETSREDNVFGLETPPNPSSKKRNLTSAQISRMLENDLTSDEDGESGEDAAAPLSPNSLYPTEKRKHTRKKLKSRSTGITFPASEPLLSFPFYSSHPADEFFVRYIGTQTNQNAAGPYHGGTHAGVKEGHRRDSSSASSSSPLHARHGGGKGGLAHAVLQPLNEEEMMLEQFAEFTDDDSFFSSGSSVLSTDPYRMEVQRGPLYSHAVRTVKDSLMAQSLLPTNTYGGEEDWIQKPVDMEWIFQVHHRALCLAHSSFFIFPPQWTPRVVVYNILHHWVTELFLFMSILVYFVFQACWERNPPFGLFEVPLIRPPWMFFADIFFTTLLGFEILLRLFSYGLLLHPRAFLRSPWHWLDLAVFILMCMTCSSWRTMWNYSGWRLLRVLKCCRYFPVPVQLKILAMSFLSSTSRLIGVTLYFIFFMFFFALLGLHLFKGVLEYRCVDDTSLVVTSQICNPGATSTYWFYWGHECAIGQSCQRSVNYNPHFGFRSFDDIGHALLSVFQIVSFQGWTSLLTETNDGMNTLVFLFYMFAIFICSWIIPALYMGVFVDRWQVVQRRFLHKQLRKYDDILNEQRQRQQASVKLEDFVTRDSHGHAPRFPTYDLSIIENKLQSKLHKPIRQIQWSDAHRVQLHLALTRNAAYAVHKERKSEGRMLALPPSSSQYADLEKKEERSWEEHNFTPDEHVDKSVGSQRRAPQEAVSFELGGRVGEVQHHPNSFGVGSVEGVQEDFATRQKASLSPFTFLSIYEEKDRKESTSLGVAMAAAAYGYNDRHETTLPLQEGVESARRSGSDAVHGATRIENGQLLRPKVLQTREIAGVHPHHPMELGGSHPSHHRRSGTLTPLEESMFLTKEGSSENTEEGPQELLIHDPEGGALELAAKWGQRWSIIRNMVHMVLEGYPRIITNYLWSYTWMIRRYGLLPLHYTNQYEDEVIRILRRRRWEKLRDLQCRRGRRPLPAYMESTEENDQEDRNDRIELDGDEEERGADEITAPSGPGDMAQQISESARPTVFSIVMYVFIFANVCTNGCRYYGMPDSWEDALFIISVIFSCVFFLELMLHLVGLGFGAFAYHGFYPVELLFVLLSFGQLGVDRSNAISLFNCIRFLRLLRISPITPMRHAASVLLIALPSLLIALFFLTIYLFMWVLIGMSLFGGRFADLTEADYSTQGSFSNFPYAVYAVMQAFSINRDQWLYLSWSGMRAHGGYTILYFILTVFTAIIFRFLFIGICTVTWMQYYRHITNRAFDALHSLKGDLSQLQDRLRRSRRAPWFDFSVWRSFKHIHGGFHRRHIAPDQIFYLHQDTLYYFGMAERRKKALLQQAEKNGGPSSSPLFPPKGKNDVPASTPKEGRSALAYYNRGDEEGRSQGENPSPPGKMSPVGTPPSPQEQQCCLSEGLLQPTSPSVSSITAVRASTLQMLTPTSSLAKDICPLCPYYSPEMKDLPHGSDPIRFRHLYNDKGELFMIPNPCHADRHSLFPHREYWLPSSSALALTEPSISLPFRSGGRSETGLGRPVTPLPRTLQPGVVPRLPLSDSGRLRKGVDDSQGMPFRPTNNGIPGSADGNGRERPISSSKNFSGSSTARCMAQRFPFAPSVSVHFHTLMEEEGGKTNENRREETFFPANRSDAYVQDASALPLNSVPTHLLLPGPQMAPYYKPLDEFNSCLDLCRDCNTFKAQPLPHAKRVAARTAEDLHREHCHMAAVRSAKQTILHALLGFVEVQVAHEVKPTRELMQVILGQAWSCGLLLFETLEHVMEEDGTAGNAGGDPSWNTMLDALRLQKWLTGLQVGEEQVGRSALAYLLAHQARQDQEVAVRHYQAPFKAAERRNSIWNNDRTFFFLAKGNSFRQIVTRIVHAMWFEIIVLCIIYAAAICLAAYTPGNDNIDMGGSYNSTKYQILHGLDDAFAILFAIELLLRWIADGVVLPVKQAYFWHLWNIFDCFIVVISLVSWGDDNIYLRYLKVFRCFRIIGILRWCRFKNLSFLAHSIWTSIPLLANICFLILCHCIIWAIIYISMFFDKMSMCSNPTIVVRKACESQGFEWVNAYDRRFTNFYESLLTTFELSTGAEWMDVMYQAVSSWSVFQSPTANKHPYLGLVFIPYYYLGHFVLFAFLLGAIAMWYSRTRLAMEGVEETASPPLARWQRMQSMSSMFSLRTQLIPFSNAVSRGLDRLLHHWIFELLMCFVIWLNAFVLCFEWSGMPPSQTTRIDVLQYIFVGCFTVEIIMRFWAHGLRDFKRPGFCWDVLVTVLSYVQIILNATKDHRMPFNVNVLRLLRVGRVLYVFCFFDALRCYATVLYVSITTAFWDLVAVGMFYALSVLVFAIAGLHFLGYVVPYSTDSAIEMPYNNFYTLVNSIAMVFRLSTLENWVSMLRGSMTSSTRCSAAAAEGVRCALTNWAPVYYIALLLCCFVLTWGLFIAVVLYHYLATTSLFRGTSRWRHLFDLRDAWEKYDPNATGVLPVEALPRILEKLCVPFGLSNRMSRVSLLRLLRAYHIPVRANDEVRYQDVWRAVARRMGAITIVEQEVDGSKREDMNWDDAWQRMEVELSILDEEAHARKEKIEKREATGDSYHPNLLERIPDGRVLNSFKPMKNIAGFAATTQFYCEEYFAVSYLQACYRRKKAVELAAQERYDLWRRSRRACDECYYSYKEFGFSRYSLAGPLPIAVSEKGFQPSSPLPKDCHTKNSARPQTPPDSSAAATSGPAAASTVNRPLEENTHRDDQSSVEEDAPAVPTYCPVLPQLYQSALLPSTVKRFGPDVEGAIRRGERRSDKLAKDAQKQLLKRGFHGSSKASSALSSGEQTSFSFPDTSVHHTDDEGQGHRRSGDRGSSILGLEQGKAIYQPPLGTDLEELRNKEIRRRAKRHRR